MSNTNTTYNSGGIGFLGALGIAFIVLKLVGVIAWSWWWVLLPLYGPWLVIFAIFGIAGLLILIGRKI